MTAKQDEAQDDLLGKIAWLYYKERMRQEDIGHALGLSRTKIQRMLERANRSTIVQVEIRHPRYNLLSVEAQLTGAYQLTDAVVVPAVANSDVVAIAAIAKAGAAYLSRTVQGGGWDVLGIGWGSTTSQLAEEFAPANTSCVTTVVSLLGTLSTSTSGHPSVPAETIAKKIGSNFYHIWAPAIAQSAEGASAFLAEPRINEVIRLARTCKLSVISIGAFSAQSPLVRMGYLSERDVSRLRKKGAVGDLACGFFTRDGTFIEDSVDARIVGVGKAILEPQNRAKSRLRVIGLGGGVGKFEAVKAALTGRKVDVLVTDEVTATKLLEEKKRSGVFHGS